MKKKVMEDECTLAGGLTRPHPGARPGVGACREALGGWAFTHGAWPGPAGNRDMGPSSSRTTTCRKNH